jgi:hypothetical protein
MANTFKNSISGSIGTLSVPVYTVPGSTSTTVIGMSVANILTNNINVSTTLTSGSSTIFLVKNATVPAGGSIVLIGGEQKLVMMANNYLSVVSTVASSADVVVSVLEIS